MMSVTQCTIGDMHQPYHCTALTEQHVCIVQHGESTIGETLDSGLAFVNNS
jgi:hypothetical protein